MPLRGHITQRSLVQFPPTDPEDIKPKYTKILANFRILIAISPFVDQSSPALLGMYGSDRCLQRRFPIDDSLFQSGDICNKVAKMAYS